MSDTRDEVPYAAWLEVDLDESWRDDYDESEGGLGWTRDDEDLRDYAEEAYNREMMHGGDL